MDKDKDVLIVKNVTREGPGYLGDFLFRKGFSFDLIDLDQGDPWPDLNNYRVLVVLGGPDSANDETPKIVQELEKIRIWLESGKPYLGICLGMQLMVKALGGKVCPSPVKEVGVCDTQNRPFSVELTQEGSLDPLFEGIGKEFSVFQLHGETVVEDSSTTLLGTGRHCRNQIVRAGQNAYGFQGHVELTEELLNVWATQDVDLIGVSRDTLQQQFQGFTQNYKQTAEKIFTNFFERARKRV